MNFGTPPLEVAINLPTRVALFRALRERFAARHGFALATLNLDHLTKLPNDEGFAAAYREQDMIVADGRPVVWLSRLAGDAVELLPGSDLIVPICEIASEAGVPVALVGSSEAALMGAAAALTNRVTGLRIVHCHAPPYGFDPDSPAAHDVLSAVADSGARMCFIALGAPKQEKLAARGRGIAPEVGFASIGAGLDFLSGHQKRAPAVMRSLAMEWLWRALQSPGRMVPRYARCLAILPGLTVRAVRARQG